MTATLRGAVPLTVRDAAGRSLADAYEADGPALADVLRVVAPGSPERGCRVVVVDVDGWAVRVETQHGRMLWFDRAELAPIAPSIVPGR